MKKLLIALALSLTLFVGTASAQHLKWDTTEKVMFGTLVATHVVDLMQTEYALDHGYHEANSLMDHGPWMRIGLKAFVTGVTWAIAHYMPKTHGWRKAVLAVPIAINVGVIGNNVCVSGGLKLSF